MSSDEAREWVKGKAGENYKDFRDLEEFFKGIQKAKDANTTNYKKESMNKFIEDYKTEGKPIVEEKDLSKAISDIKDSSPDQAQKIYDEINSYKTSDGEGYSSDTINKVESMVGEKLDDAEEVQRIEEMIQDLARAREGSEDTVDQINNKIQRIERAMEDTPGTGSTRSKYGKQLGDDLSTEISEGAYKVYNLKQKRTKLEEGNNNG